MKILTQHLEVLKQAFSVYTKEQLVDHMQAYAKAGLTERRARFDAFWAVNKNNPSVKDMMKEFYKYGNDDHLYTALKTLL